MTTIFRHAIAFTALYLLSVSPLGATEWDLSYGLNDMVVDGARPLEVAPDGSTSHTFGLQIAIHGRSSSDARIQQQGYFKTLVDLDKDKLDPDHIPVWFLGHYQAEGEWLKLGESNSLNLLFEADAKTNSVSSVERLIKLFSGLSLQHSGAFSASVKAEIGRYAFEIDDDVPKTRGYTRSDLKNVSPAYTLMADTIIPLGSAVTLQLLGQTWRNKDRWLENQYQLELNYNASHWIKDSQIVLNITHSEYNLELYNHDDTTAPGYLPILPWNKDTLLQASIIIPWRNN